MIKIKKLNESFVSLNGLDLGLAKTLSDYFSFYAENYRFTPKYKNGFWDGKIRLFNIKNHTLPIGCWFEAYKLLKSLNQQVKIDKNLKSDTDFVDKKFIKHFVANTVKQNLQPREYQISIIEKVFKYQKAIIVSPTSSGKTFIISLIIDILQYLFSKTKILVIVPNVSLIYQMMKDILDYHENKETIEKRIKLIYDIKYDIKSENLVLPENSIIISTWQSIQSKFKIPKLFFEQFNCLIIDEAHSAGAKELSEIVSKCSNAKFKLGFTGTLSNSEAKEKQLRALFGKKIEEITTSELIKEGYIANLNILVYFLKYTHPKYRQMVRNKSKKKYWIEMDRISNHPERIQFIADLLFKLQGVTLYLFKNIENNFSKKLLDYIAENIENMNRHGKNIPVYYIDGSTESSEREMIREKVIKENKGIIVASFGTFSQGINIPNLKNVIFAEPTKSKIKVMQSIGRALRKNFLKDTAYIIDIVDVIPGKQNYFYRHFKERLTMYKQEKFKVILKGIYEITSYYKGEKFY